MVSSKEPLNYKKTGVDIEKGDRLVHRIGELARRTFREEVLTGIGGFGGIFALKYKDYKEPVLVAGTDGVGTKLKVANLCRKYDTVGIDLVAMNVNDILVHGAEPLFFLDYLATSRLVMEQAQEIIKGIVTGCSEAGCSLIGGETAEMPDIFQGEEFELAGFAVGIVEREKIINRNRVKEGDRIIGLASNGLHSNGYSLARKVIFEQSGLQVNDMVLELEGTVGEEMLKPTRIYVSSLLPVITKYDVHGIAHITGGGIIGNVPRVLPEGMRAVIQRGTWTVPPIFSFLQRKGNINEQEMFHVFNMGIGMVLIIASEQAGVVIEELEQRGEMVYQLGEVVVGTRGVEII